MADGKAEFRLEAGKPGATQAYRKPLRLVEKVWREKQLPSFVFFSSSFSTQIFIHFCTFLEMSFKFPSLVTAWET